ncbi:unnamed protein product [Periconia digitata]|uniref:EF-hand domain-containing protein n=1 Tax=Periconia digitata TaxID=1303443 RepID=A0A9W4XX66_9PLEO|nr:unnamed protein product [Periconia digitata]
MTRPKFFVPFTWNTLQSVDEVFDDVDTDNSGVVSADELYKSINKIVKDFSESEATKLLKEFDGDNDGKLTYRVYQISRCAS